MMVLQMNQSQLPVPVGLGMVNCLVHRNHDMAVVRLNVFLGNLDWQRKTGSKSANVLHQRH
jgi:hypothetical protein